MAAQQDKPSIGDRLRRAALYFRFHRDNPHVPMESGALAEHLAAIAEHGASAEGHDVESPQFASGREGDPTDDAPGRDDLPKGWRPGQASLPRSGEASAAPVAERSNLAPPTPPTARDAQA